MNPRTARSCRTLPLLALALLWPLVSWSASASTELKVVPSIDLPRYAGKWYEVARLPNHFERHCDFDTTARYTLRPDGRITVVNACRREDGRTESATGVAKLASANGPNSKLRVSFFRPFYANYWVIDLDRDYRWAVVGEPRRRYFWILARDPELDRATLDGILERARAQGYDLSTLRMARSR